jgi:hypothetical protein
MPIKRTLIPILLVTATPVSAEPLPDDQVPRELISLRSELFDAGRERALEQMPRFRPLCDADGYPLVGNVVRKSGLYQPSAFCAEVRRRAGKT